MNLFRLILPITAALALGAQAPAPSRAIKPAIVPKSPYRILIHSPLAGWTLAPSVSFDAEVQGPAGSATEGQNRLLLQSWINGTFEERPVQTGERIPFTIQPVGGENRIELRLAGTKVSAIRTFWGKSAVERLRIRLVQARSDEFWYRTPYGWLEVVEPDGSALTSGSTPSGGHGSWDWYSHAQPPAGTWTLRWKYNLNDSDPNASTTAGSAEGFGDWGQTGLETPDSSQDTSMGKGIYRGKVYIEVVLDAGTDREQRWIFDRLFLPGRAQITLGSFDIAW